jgi:membrane complex biogenesis BtpA family protein
VTRLIGVVHLAALPGSPRSKLPLSAVIDRALADAKALERGGADALIVENYHDAPFRPGAVDAHTVAAMAVVVKEIRTAVGCDVGVNVLRNDAAAALGIAAATGARFIRVNVHCGAVVADQGIIQGRADETLRLRRALDAESVAIYADVLVKHAAPLGHVTIADAVRDVVERGLADAVIVSGAGTGRETAASDVREAARATSAPVLVGSGVTVENVARVVPPASGVIVGSSLKRDGRIDNPVDVERVRALRAALDRAAPANETPVEFRQRTHERHASP